MRFVLVFLLLLFSVEVLAKNPLSEGFLLLEKGDYKRAFSNFSSIKKKEPYVYTAMGMAKALSGDYEKAIDYLFIATEDKKESNNWVPNFFLGLCFYNLKRYDDAIPFLEKSYSLNSEKESLILLGKSYFKINNYKKSEEIFEKIYKEQKDEEIFLSLARSKYHLDKISEAESILNEAIKYYPQNPFLLYERGKIRFKKGELELAEKDIESALKLSDNPEIQKIYSSIKLSKIGKKEEKKTIGIFPSKNSILYSLSLFLLILIFLRIRLSRNLNDKFLFAKTLLEKADYINAGNIFAELMKYKNFEESALKGFIIAKILLGKAEDSLSLAKNLKDETDRFFYFAIIYLYFGDKEDFIKYLDLLEQIGQGEKVKLLKGLSYSDKKNIVPFLLKELN